MPTPPPVAPPGGQDQGPAEGAEQAVDMIKRGFDLLGQLMQAAGPKLDPGDIKLYQAAVQATDTLLQTLMAPMDEKQQGAPAPRQAGGPMPQNANAQAKPAPQY